MSVLNRAILHPAMRAGFRLRKLHAAVFRPVTLGVRALVIDDAQRVLLIRHTYVPGWFMPGGGVSKDESMPAAVARELYEEAGVRPTAPPVLLGIYANFLQLKSDHVAVYHVPRWEQADDIPHLGLEIAEAGFFPISDLPAGTSPGTRQRIDEFLSGRVPTEFW